MEIYIKNYDNNILKVAAGVKYKGIGMFGPVEGKRVVGVLYQVIENDNKAVIESDCDGLLYSVDLKSLIKIN